MTRKFLILLGLILTITLTAYGDEVGEITYIQGTVEIVRDGETIDESELDTGIAIENLDLIKTSEDGKLNFKLNSSITPKAEIAVSPGTVFTVDVNKVGKTNATTLDMVTGSLSIKAQKLAGNMGLSVRTDTATMGVRGTTFEVESSPAGDILVSCEEGKVECVDDSGTKLDAEPGQVVEKDEDLAFKAIPVKVTSLKKWRQDWLAEKVEAFKANPRKAIKNFARRYKKAVTQFDAAYASLMKKEKILKKWFREEKEKKMSGKMERMKEKKAIMRDLMRIRKSAFILEKIYYRLNELYSYYKQGYGEGELENGETSAQFFNKFQKVSKQLEKKMHQVRFIAKLYAKRNEGSFPLDAMGSDDDIDGGNNDNFFRDDGF